LYNCPTLFNDTENKEIYWIGFPDEYVDGPSLCPTVDVSSTTDPTLEPLLTIEENDEDGGYFVKADFDPIADQPLSGTTGVWTVTLTYGLAPCGSTPNPGGDEENLDQNPVFGYPSDYRLPTLPTSQALPDTGSSTTNVMLAFGTVLIAAGGSIVIRSRRTRSI
jgi:LPXTG-motif cell wall-anchored protein